jgi:hypothetical protein
MTSPVFDKTAKGREEIATRQHRLASRLRILLLLIDGKHSTEDLLPKVAGIGLTEAGIGELLDQGFIEEAVPVAAIEASAPTMTKTGKEDTPQADTESASPVFPDGQSQFEAIYRFYTSTIRNTMGLRGYALQIKVEKAASIDDFRQLRRPYLEAVLKASGNEMERSLRSRLDELLYYGEPVPPHTTLIGPAITR